MRRLARRAANWLAAPYFHELSIRIAEVDRRVEHLHSALGPIHVDLKDELQVQRTALAEGLGASDEQMQAIKLILRHISEEDALQRRRLYALRESEEYDLAFSEEAPLISYVIPTYNRFEQVRDVSLPSILAQTHSNIEVIVAGDRSPEETAAAVAEIGDPRVCFHNRSVRGPYPDDEAVRWYMIGTPPYNDGVNAARGRWIATLGDDDAVVPEHAETLLAAAREHRHEHCYGRHRVHYPSGETLEIGSFPPVKGEFVLQASIYHAGLRFFQMEPADYLFEEPNDWSLCRRMLTAGVRFGMVEDFVANKHESRYHSHDDWGTYGVPSVE